MSVEYKKYLSQAEINALIGDIIIDASFEMMSQDSYNEVKIGEAIKATKKATELCMASINMAIVGYGNKKFGTFRYKDAIVDIAQLLSSSGVKINLGRDAKLREEELTPGRLCRFFRNHIRDYILTTKATSYLFRKYSDRNPDYAHLLFRGCEYLDDLTMEQINAIRDTYTKLDIDRSTEISKRVLRVFEAKGYFQPAV